MVDDNALLPAIVQELLPMDLFKPDNMKQVIEYVSAEAKKHKSDLTTVTGRKAIASNANLVARSKTFLDKIGKEAMAEKKAEIKSFNESAKKMRDSFDAIKVEVRKDLTEWEQIEKERLARVDAGIAGLKVLVPLNAKSDEVKIRIDELRAFDIPSEWNEAITLAQEIKNDSLTSLQEMYDKLKKDEENAAELAKLKAEAEKHKKEEDERQRKEEANRQAEELAEERVRKAQLDADEAERKAKESEERAEREKIRREESEKREEEERVKRKKKVEEEAKRQLEAKAKDEKEIIDALVSNCTVSTETAEIILTAIKLGTIPGVSLNI